MRNKEYIIITPARNEEMLIEKTIKSVISQTVLPEKWIIVSDGSTDRTDEIVEKYAVNHDFIELIRMPNRKKRNYAHKVFAFNEGYRAAKRVPHQFVGNLDADISFEPDYYERILNELQKNPNLGLAGGLLYCVDGDKIKSQESSLNSVGGPIQLFRRECFEQIGGYWPLKKGGIDAAAEIMARKIGYEVRTFIDIHVLHHRRLGAAHSHRLKSAFLAGIKFRLIGYHPAFYFLRAVPRALRSPFLIGSILNLCGYCWAVLRHYQIEIPSDVVKFLRSEQMTRLRRLSSL